MIITSWNVNSVRARIENIKEYLQKFSPDVVMMQEIKTQDETFPYDDFSALDYESHVFGQKSYNGVAIISKHKLENVRLDLIKDKLKQSRIISAELKYGLIPEFIGRLPMIATLEDLDEKTLVKILQEPKNSLIKQYQELFKLDGAKLNFKENALKEIAHKAINKKTGARGLRSILENILLKTMYDLPSQDNVEEVIVDASAAKGLTQPIIVHSKNSTKTKTDKTSAA